MAKISGLPLVADPDGSETVVVLKDGVAQRAPLDTLVGASVDAAIDAAGDELDAKVTSAGESAGIAADEADRAELALSGINRSVGRSAKFHDFNGHWTGAWNVIAQPTANFGTWFGPGTGMFFTVFTLPQERLLSPRVFHHFGNNFTGGNNIGLRFYGYTYTTAAKRGTMELLVKNAAYTFGFGALPITVRRAAAGYWRNGNSLQAFAVDMDTGTVYPGAVVDCTALTTGLSAFNGNMVLIGGMQQTAAEWVPSVGTSLWTGEIEWIGYATASAGLSDVEALAAGSSPIDVFGAAHLPFVRHLDGTTATLGAAPGATSDTTTPGTLYGSLGKGGNIQPTGKLALDKDSDGQCYAVMPGQLFGRVQIGGRLIGLAADDVVEATIYNENGDTIVPWTAAGNVANGDTRFDLFVQCPPQSKWLTKAARLKSDPGKVFFDGTLFSVGTCSLQLGQSELQQMMSNADLQVDYSQVVPLSYAETTTQSGVKGQRIRRLIPGLYASDGLVAGAEQLAKLCPGGIMWITDGVPNTSMADWINDSHVNRLWSDTDEALAFAKRQVGVVELGGWFTAMRDAGSDQTNLVPAILGTGPNISDHWMFEEGFLPSGIQIVMARGKNENAGPVGPAAYDTDNVSGAARQMFGDWADAHANIIKRGPEGVYELGDQYHPISSNQGKVRFGIDCAVRVAIGMGAYKWLEAYVDPGSFKFAAGNESFTFSVVNPNNRPIRNRKGATYNSGDADKYVGGIEVSIDGGVTWAYLGLGNAASVGDAHLSGRFDVTATSATGAWPANLQVRVGKGGPFGYGINSADAATSQRWYWLYDGDPLIDAGIGNAVRTSEAVYAVAAA